MNFFLINSTDLFSIWFILIYFNEEFKMKIIITNNTNKVHFTCERNFIFCEKIRYTNAIDTLSEKFQRKKKCNDLSISRRAGRTNNTSE